MFDFDEFDCDLRDEDDATIILTLDDDTEIECRVETVFTVDDMDYVALKPYDSEIGGVYLYRFSQADGDISLTNIEDEEEFELVADTYDA